MKVTKSYDPEKLTQEELIYKKVTTDVIGALFSGFYGIERGSKEYYNMLKSIPPGIDNAVSALDYLSSGNAPPLMRLI
jgi:hypothetical protein